MARRKNKTYKIVRTVVFELILSEDDDGKPFDNAEAALAYANGDPYDDFGQTSANVAVVSLCGKCLPCRQYSVNCVNPVPEFSKSDDWNPRKIVLDKIQEEINEKINRKADMVIPMKKG